MKLVRVKGVSKREKEPRVLTLSECHRLLAELGEPYRTMVALSIATGLRCSELFALKWSDFDWANSTMFVQRAIVDGVVDDVKTKYSKAGLPLDPALAALMLRWKGSPISCATRIGSLPVGTLLATDRFARHRCWRTSLNQRLNGQAWG
jgi:integrase